MKKAIVIGASSGIGKELAKVLAEYGYEVALMARRVALLEELQKSIPTKTYIGHIDLSNAEDARQKTLTMIDKMGGLDLMVINAGIGLLNLELAWEKEKQTIDVNVTGFCALAVLSYNFFAKQKRGHLVGVSSVGAVRGNAEVPAYNASKAFMSNYLEGLRKKANLDNLPIYVTDIKPGFIDTEMGEGVEGKFWVASARTAAEQIYDGICKKRSERYVIRRWALIGWVFKLMPSWLYQSLGKK